MRNYRKRKAQENKTPQATTSTDPTPTPIIYNFNHANKNFQNNVLVIHVIMLAICDRLWCMNDLKQVTEKHIVVLALKFPDMYVAQVMACVTCTATLDSDQVHSQSISNGFTYPSYPTNLPPLDCISEGLVAPRLPFIQIRRLRHQMGGYGIVRQVINVPVDVNNMVTTLPRQLGNDYSFNVHLKRNLIRKSMYLEGCIKKGNG
jgi:hypothetical protein